MAPVSAAESGTNPTTSRSHVVPVRDAVVGGVVAAAAIAASAKLAAVAIAASSSSSAALRLGAPPGWRSWLAAAVVGPGSAAEIQVLLAGGLVAAMVCGALLSRRLLGPGMFVVIAIGATAAWAVGSAGSSVVQLTVPIIATSVGMVTFASCLRSARRASPPPSPAQALRSGADARPPRRHWGVPRRQVLVTGLLVAAGAAVTGFMARSTAAPRDVTLRITGGPPLLTNAPIVNVHFVGAIGDGRTDDGDAIRRGMDAVNRSGGTLYFPAGTYYYRATGPLRPAANVTLAGMPGSSTIAFDFPGATDFVEFCSVDADGVIIDGLTIRRVNEFPAVLVSLGEVQGFALSRSALIGNQDIYPGADCHGIKLGDTGTAGALQISDSTVATVTYGLLRTNASTAVVKGATVTRCTFTGNRNTDLEFNSPRGSIEQVRVTGCTFSNNDSPGFGVGLAHVLGGVVQNNTFNHYSLEAVHIEDYSEDITVDNNSFVSCGLQDYSHVQIISGSRRVTVTGNTFHASMNANKIYLINALPGGNTPTAGGRPSSAPVDVAVQNNTFDCATAVVPVYFQGVRGGSITSNAVTGDALTEPSSAFRLLEDSATSISDNIINGRRY